MRKARVFMHGKEAGVLTESDQGFQFMYHQEYLADANAPAISLSIPRSSSPYTSRTLFAFFDGLIPEGWLLRIAEKNWKLDPRDRMGLLMACCVDCVGAVSIEPINEPDHAA